MKPVSKIYIPVKVSEGMFSTERAIELTLADGKVVSFFADNSLIKETDGDCPKLAVTLFFENEDKSLHVLLPQHPFESYGSIWADIPAISKIPSYSN